MARPTSARARAGGVVDAVAHMATFLPWSWSSFTFRSLSWGSTWAMTSVTPSSWPMASAVRWLSPVSMTTSRPSFRKAATAAALVGLGVSATAMRPSTWRSSAKYRAVLPWAASSSAFAGKLPRSTPASSIIGQVAAHAGAVPQGGPTPRAPRRAAKFPTEVTGRFRFLLSSTMAVARGARRGPPDRLPE